MDSNARLESLEIRPYRETDCLRALTALLHRAYAPLAHRGMRYLASHQSESVTRERITADGAEGFLAVLHGRPVGTVTLRPPQPDSDVPWYARPDVCTFEQLAVDPDFQGRGIGARLLGHVEARAIEHGAAELACDTSERAAELIDTYTRRGYRVVARTNWDVTNYQSVILSCALRSERKGDRST